MCPEFKEVLTLWLDRFKLKLSRSIPHKSTVRSTLIRFSHFKKTISLSLISTVFRYKMVLVRQVKRFLFLLQAILPFLIPSRLGAL